MSKPYVLTDDEQISWIDQAIEYGWRIQEVRISGREGASVVFRKMVPREETELTRGYFSGEIVEQTLGVGIKAADHAIQRAGLLSPI